MERNILTRERLVSLRLLMRKKHIDYYTREGDLPNLLPEKEDGTPIGIKAILWNRLDHWSYYPANADEFKKWYKEQYVANTKTHRQLLSRQ